MARRTYNFAGLSRDVLESVLGMLSGQYPSDEFADLKPRVIWDRTTDIVSSRRDAKTVAIVNAGTIPDRGLYGVFLGDGGPRVGELDEEMVYESRAGETFVLGATTWRIEQITRDRVIVSPAPGEPGKMPFWKGDGVGRPLEFGRAVGAFTRELDAMKEPGEAAARLMARHDLDERAANNLLAYLADEKEATGVLPTDRTAVVERFRDELGDWRVVVLTPFGGRVHAPWAQAIEARLVERGGFDVQTIWSDDGLAVRFAGGEEPPPSDVFFPSPEEVEDLVVGRLADSTMFASRFRENAGRALLLPRMRPGTRSPLWLQRQRSANLLAVASRYGSFPIILETYRECLQDVFDLPGLAEILGQVRSREIRVTNVETQEASPFARSLLFDYVAAYMYEGDAPLAERRAQALTLDRNLLRDLLGEAELRELLDAEALTQVELELQCLVQGRKARNVDHVHDLLRRLGDLTEYEAGMRSVSDAEPLLAELERSHRACRVRVGGEERWIAIEDAGRYRDAIGVSPPQAVPAPFLVSTSAPLDGLLARYARTHGPFLAGDPARRWAIPESLVREALERLEAAGTVVHGDFRPGGLEREWCDQEVLRQLRRRSLARLRREVEPVDGATFARFLAKWQGAGSGTSGVNRLREVLCQMAGLSLPASVLERDVFPLRVSDYRPALLDELLASGEVAWAGRGRLGLNDGRVALVPRERLSDFGSTFPGDVSTLSGEIRSALGARGALFFTDIVAATRVAPRDAMEALWELVWDGVVTNDTFAPMRALAWPRRHGPTPRPRSGGLPPETVGRWSLISTPDESAAAATARAHALANALLDRYGVVTREAVASEGIAGGFSAVYPVLKAMEEGGRIRRGYFIEGLGAAQFALPGAVERLRAERELPDEPDVRILAATDPANPYGAALPWPRKDDSDRRGLQRAAGAFVVLVNGEAALYVERGGRSVVTFPAFEPSSALVVTALGRSQLSDGRGLTIERIDGQPAGLAAARSVFEGAGFVSGYRGLTYRPPKEALASARRR